MSTREQLVDATKELLWEYGYEAMSPRAIQERSGVGQGSFYHHFKGKGDLAVTTLQVIQREMEESFEVILGTDKPPLDRIRDYLMQPRAGLHGCRLGKLTQEPMINDEHLRTPITSYFAHLEQALTRTLEQAQQEVTISETIIATDVAATLVAVVQGGYVLARASQDASHLDRAIRGALVLLDEMKRGR